MILYSACVHAHTHAHTLAHSLSCVHAPPTPTPTLTHMPAHTEGM